MERGLPRTDGLADQVSADYPCGLLAAESMRESASLQGREPWVLEDLNNLVDEFPLPRRKLVGHWLPHKPREHAGVDSGGVERTELIDESTKLAGPQQHRVVLGVVDSHGSRHGVPASCVQKTRLYFEIQLKMKKKAAALAAITAQTPAPIVLPLLVVPMTHHGATLSSYLDLDEPRACVTPGLGQEWATEALVRVLFRCREGKA
jgi:hypothetical protein